MIYYEKIVMLCVKSILAILLIYSMPAFALITVTPGEVIFPDTTIGQSSIRTINILNEGNNNATLLIGTDGLGFTIDAGCEAALAPGVSCALGVTFTPPAIGTYNGGLSISENGASNQIVSLTGNGVSGPVPLISVTPTGVPFGVIQVGTTAAQTITVKNTGTANLIISDIAVSAGNFSISSFCTTTYVPGADCIFSVQFSPTALGPRTGTVTITSNASNVATWTVSLTGTGAAPPIGNLDVSPTPPPYPDTKIGLQQNQQFVVTNSGNAAANITGVTISGTNASDFILGTNTCAGSIAGLATCAIDVAFKPAALGNRAAQIKIAATNSTTQPIINIGGNGTALCAPTISPSTIAAGGNVTLTANCTAIRGVTASYTWTILGQTLTTTNAALPFTVPAATTPATVPVNVTTNGQTLSYPTATALTITAPLIGNLVATPTSFAYPDTQLGTQQSNIFTITNNGTGAATVTGITFTGVNAAEFTQTNTCTAAIAPTATCKVNVVFKPTAIGNRVAQVAITASNSATQPSIAVTGIATAPVVTIAGTSIAFPSVTVGASNTQTITVQNTGTANLVISSVAITGTDFTQTNTCTAPVIPNGNCVITTKFSPTAAVARTGTITITDNAGGSPRAVSLTGTGTAALVPFVTLLKTTVAFPNVTVGTSNTQTVTVQNTGTANLVVSSVAITGTDFTQTNNCATAVTPNNSCAITTVFSPTAAVVRTGTITINSNASNGAVHAVSLTGTGTVVLVGNLAVEPTPPPYPDTKVGLQQNQQFVVTNSGNAAANITGVTITGTNAGDFILGTNTCAGAIAAQATCKINVAFKPAALGNRAAQINIAATNSTTQPTINLGGNGTALCAPTATPNPATQGQSIALTANCTAIPGVTSTYTWTVFNQTTPTTSPTLSLPVPVTATGVQTASLTTNGQSLNYPVTFSVNAVQVTQPLVPSVGALAFAETKVGQPAELSVVVKNTSAGNLLVSSQITGNNATDFSGNFVAGQACYQVTLTTNQSCTQIIKFTPTATGVRAAELKVSDDQGHVLALPITGVAVGLGLTPAQIKQTATQQIATNLKSMQQGMQAQLGNINKRMRYLRFQDSTPGFQQEIDVSVNGKSIPVPNGSSDSSSSDAGGGGCGASGTQGGGGSEKCDKDKEARGTRSGRWGAYISGSVGVSEDTLNSAKISTNGMTIGTDYRLSGKSAVGAAFGTMRSSTTMAADAGKQDASGYSFVAYGSFAPSQKTYVDIALTLGNNQFDLQRADGVGGTAVADTSGSGLGLSLTAGYDIRSGGWVLTPYGRVEYVNAKVKAYAERGIDGIAVSDQSMTSSLMTVGGEIQYIASTSWGIFVPHLRVEFQNQSQSAADATAQAVGSGVQLTVSPDLNKDKSFGNMAVGASAQFGRGKTGFLDVEKTFSKENIKDQRITAGFKVEF